MVKKQRLQLISAVDYQQLPLFLSLIESKRLFFSINAHFGDFLRTSI